MSIKPEGWSATAMSDVNGGREKRKVSKVDLRQRRGDQRQKNLQHG